MGQKRRAEARQVRQWDGDVAAANDLDEVRTWVVWGLGADPTIPDRGAAEEDIVPPTAQPANDVATTMVVDLDPEWADAPGHDRWALLLDADKDDIDEWAQDDERVSGYAPYLIEPADASAAPMAGTLRNDNVVRRTGGRFDAGRPR